MLGRYIIAGVLSRRKTEFAGRPFSERGNPHNGSRQAEKPTGKKKRSFKEEREYSELPNRIAALESEQQALHARVAGPEFYKEGAGAIKTAVTRLEVIDRELLAAYARWDELDSIAAD